jgi:hypothetical protein
MAIFDAFIGPSSTSASVNVDAERTVNLYAEATGDEGATGKAKVVLLGTPGLTLYCTLPTSPVRGMWSNSVRLFAAAGAAFYEIFNQAGLVTTAGTSVSIFGGGPFDNVNGVAGNTIYIAGVPYTVASYASSTALTLTTSAGAQTGVAFSCATYNSRGAIANDGLPVTMVPNGNQLLVVSAGVVYCDNGSGPVQPSYSTTRSGTVTVAGFGVLLAFVNWASGDLFDATMVGQNITINSVVYLVNQYISPKLIHLGATSTAGTWAYSANYPVAGSTGCFLDGYFIIAQPNWKQINFSAINDGTTWSSLDHATKTGYPDNIAATLADHEELWLLGTDTTEVWQNTGAALNPLSRIAGGFIQRGCCAPASPVKLKDGVAWLSSDPARGGTQALLATGFQPTPVSTHAVETAWAGYATVADAVSYTYTERGHEWWIISFPTANATWAYDATMGWWSERAWWNGASLDRQRQAFHAFAFAQHLVGDWSNGKIYAQTLAAFTDNGIQINRIRTAPHLSSEQLYSYYSRFQLDLELGQSTSTPTVSLSWSDDGGHTFNTPIPMTPTTATFAAMIVWRRLGKSRDRVFSITITDAVKIALIRAMLDVEQGTR